MAVSLATLSSTTERSLAVAENNLLTRPALLDPVTKLRVSSPTSLIDTDFEYGPQASKWETYQSVQGYGGFYQTESDSSIGLISISMINATDNKSAVLQVQTSVPHGFVKGDGFVLRGTKSITADGNYVVMYVANTTRFTFLCSEQQTILELCTSTTKLFPARIFQGGAQNVDYVTTDGASPASTLTIRSGVGMNPYSVGTQLHLLNTRGKKVIDFTPQTNVIPSDAFNYTNYILFPDHRLSAGEKVVYRAANGSAPVLNLVDGQEYIVQLALKDRIFLSGTNLSVRILIEPGTATGVHMLECVDEGSADGTYTITSRIDDYTFNLSTPFRIPVSTLTFDPMGTILTHNSHFFIRNHGMSPGTSTVVYSKGTSSVPITGLVDGQSYGITYVDQDIFSINDIVAGTLVPVSGLHSFTNPCISGQVVVSRKTVVTDSSDIVKVDSDDTSFFSTTRMYDPLIVEQERDQLFSSTLAVTSVDAATNVITLASNHGWQTGTRATYNFYLSSDYRRACTISVFNYSTVNGTGNVMLRSSDSPDYSYLYNKYANTTFKVEYDGVTYNITFNSAYNSVIRNTTILRSDGTAPMEGEIPLRSQIVMYELLTDLPGYSDPIPELTIGDTYYARVKTANSVTLHRTRAQATADTNVIDVSSGFGTLGINGQFSLTSVTNSVATTSSAISPSMIGNTGANQQGWQNMPGSSYAAYNGVYAIKYHLGEGEVAMSGLVDGRLYYVRGTGASALQFYTNLADAIAKTNIIPIPNTATASGYVVGISLRLRLSTTVKEIMTRKSLTTTHTSTFSAVSADMVMPTYTVPACSGIVLHRAFDGGVELVPSSFAGARLVRQTRRYFRYQSGKGTQMSVGVNFSGASDIESIKSDGTVSVRTPHRITPGVSITISGVTGVDAAIWNKTGVVVQSIVDSRTFTVLPFDGVSATYSPGRPKYTVDSWTGACVRIGMYDDQNGMFYEYDGSQLYAVRRNSTQQLPGTLRTTRNSIRVYRERADTFFTNFLTVGDTICIRGMTYTVSSVYDFWFDIHPPYRGSSSNSIIASIVQDLRVPSSEWSLDKCDGNGASGYSININKMQMIYMDYSWYGAGKIRFGMKGVDGTVFYVHEFKHNNNEDTAYMRSGNLPARYEVCNSPSYDGVISYTPKMMHWGTSVIIDGAFDSDKAFFFTVSGRTLTYGNGDTITMNGVYNTAATFQRLDPFTGSNITTYRIIVTSYELVKNLRRGTPVIAPDSLPDGTTIVSVQRLSDGSAALYIDKRPVVAVSSTQFSFVAGNSDDVIPSRIPLVSFRLSPSVDNGYTSDVVGERDIVNRMQLCPLSVDILTSHDAEIVLLLNGFPLRKLWQAASSPSLAQVLYHEGDIDSDVIGGTPIFSFRAAGGVPDATGRRNATNTTIDVSNLTPLGNSLVGGDDIYPNGPDIMTIAATIVDSTGITSTTPFSVSARLSWTESQA